VRVVAALAACVALLLAGCSGSGAAVSVPPPGPAQPPEETPHQDLRLREAGALRARTELAWTWEVPEGAREFRVELRLDGPAGAPTGPAGVGLHAALLGPRGVVAEWGDGGGDAVQVVPEATCAICLDLARHHEPGAHRLTLRAHQAAGGWSLALDVAAGAP